MFYKVAERPVVTALWLEGPRSALPCNKPKGSCWSLFDQGTELQGCIPQLTMSSREGEVKGRKSKSQLTTPWSRASQNRRFKAKHVKGGTQKREREMEQDKMEGKDKKWEI